MRWHKEGIHDREGTDIMSHPMDVEAWRALDCFDLEFAWDPGVSDLFYEWMVFILVALIVLCTLAGQFS
jgi:hypothetical protein